MTWVRVADGQAVNHDGARHGPGVVLDAEDRLAAKWLERQVVLPARPPARRRSRISVRGAVA